MTTATDLLPDSVAEIAALIGYVKTKALIERLGGARFRFTGPFGAIVLETIGQEAHDKLVDYYGGEVVELARCQMLLRALKVSETMAALDQGASTNSVALAAGVSRRTIRNWKKTAKSVQLNFDIFGDEL